MKKQIVGNLVKFTFDDGVEPLTFDCTKMSGANRAYAIPFGMCHRLGDMAAIPRSDKDGNVVTVTERMRHDAVKVGIDHYESATDQWELRVARAPVRNPTWQAIADKRGVAYDVIAAEMAQRDLDMLAAL